MASKMTRTECFAVHGVVPKNNRWSWSGRSPDGSRVAVVLWQDKFADGGKAYRSEAHSSDEKWFGSNGHNELIENLQHAKEMLSGVVYFIVARAKDPLAEPRSIDECFTRANMQMEIVHFDPVSGAFELRRA